jgi:hypothetical protein
MSQRIGAICNDGTFTNATGRGAGSHHGGVGQWIYGNNDTSSSNKNLYTIGERMPSYGYRSNKTYDSSS